MGIYIFFFFLDKCTSMMDSHAYLVLLKKFTYEEWICVNDDRIEFYICTKPANVYPRDATNSTGQKYMKRI